MSTLQMPNRFYESFPYQSRVKLGERIFNSFNRHQYKRSKAQIKESRHLTDHPGLPYFEVGNPNKPTLLFLHGFGDTKETYLRQALAFKKDFHVIVPDMPGFGPNPRMQDLQYSSQIMAEILHQFIIEIDLKNIQLAGNSMGGAISSFLALKAPDRIKSLTLIDTAGFYFDHVHSVLDEFLDGENLFLVSQPDDYRNLFSRVFHKTPYIPKPVFEYLYEQIKRENLWYKKMVLDLTHNMDSIEEGKETGLLLNNYIHELEMPTQLIWGDKDSLFPVETAHEIKKLKPSIDLHIINDCGHAPHFERHKEFNKLMKVFGHQNS